MESPIQIKNEQKIALISLGNEIDNNPEMTMSKAYRIAQRQLHFGGSIGDFMDILKSEGLIATEDSKKEADKIAEIEKNKAKIKKGFLAITIVGVAVLVLTNLKKN